MISAGDANHPALEETASLFQPDCLLPVQYFENFRGKVQSEPEKRLMLAVLDDALACYQKHFPSRGGRGLRLFRETEEWIFWEESGRPFSFTNICEVVGFDPQYVRQGLLRWKEMRPRVEMLKTLSYEGGTKNEAKNFGSRLQRNPSRDPCDLDCA